MRNSRHAATLVSLKRFIDRAYRRTLRRFENSRNVDVLPFPVLLLERFERLEPAAVLDALNFDSLLQSSDSRLFKKVQMRRAREIERAEAYLLIRWSEAIERNEAGGPFSTAC